MFAKFCALALAALPLAFALTIDPLTDATAGGTVTITWTASTTDAQYFSVLMVNPNNFHDTFAIATTVSTSLGKLVVTLPQMPAGGGYSLEAIDISDVNTVYSQSSTFSVGATANSTTTETTTSSISSTSSSTISTLSVTTVVSSTSTSAPQTSTPSSSATTSSHSGAVTSLRLGDVAPVAALLLSVVAGAAIIL